MVIVGVDAEIMYSGVVVLLYPKKVANSREIPGRTLLIWKYPAVSVTPSPLFLPHDDDGCIGDRGTVQFVYDTSPYRVAFRGGVRRNGNH